MQYSSKIKFHGDVHRFLESAQAIMLPNGFRLEELSDKKIQMSGRGMQSTKEDPIRGATHVSLEIVGEEIFLEANLGGVKFMTWFICLFPMLMFAGFAILPFFMSEADNQMAEQVVGWQRWGGLLFWLVAGPLIAFWMRRRTIGALQDVVASSVLRAS